MRRLKVAIRGTDSLRPSTSDETSSFQFSYGSLKNISCHYLRKTRTTAIPAHTGPDQKAVTGLISSLSTGLT